MDNRRHTHSTDPHHICDEHCSHQYIEQPIKTADQLDRYISDIKDTGLVLTRRQFVKSAVYGTALLASAGSLFSILAGCASDKPSGSASGATADVEKPDLNVGFLPITCATPILAAGALNFYKKHGLNVTLKKYGGFAEIRDAFIAGEIDAAHMLSPMTMALELGLGSAKIPTRLAATENVNGQAITMAIKHKDKIKSPKDLKGLTLGIPFDYSIHNLLLRHFLTQGGLDPDKDVTLRVTRPPDMIALTASGGIDGYIVSDPFNQRAVFEGIGYIYQMTGDLWPNHPCCAFAVKQDFIDKYPKTYHTLLTSIVEATNYCSGDAHRAEIAKAIAPKQFLNQPEDVVSAVLTGKLKDTPDHTISKPKYIDFDPFPWKSAAAWFVSQMIRWGYIPQDQATPEAIRKIVDAVYLSDGVRQVQKELGLKTPTEDYRPEVVMGKTFDLDHLQDWIKR
ncbi:MAG: nrtA [Paenibacillaceae bacterium]|nr:nrtA [Paenibacillaceae bacterium]